MIIKKPWIEKLFFMVSEFMEFSWGFLNSCPIKKPWVFREWLKINGSWKMKWLSMSFSLPMNYAPRLLFMGRTETWPPWKFSLKLFSTVKSNTMLVVVKITLKIIMNQNNERRKHTNKKTWWVSSCICWSVLDSTCKGLIDALSSFHYHIASHSPETSQKKNKPANIFWSYTGYLQLTFHCQLRFSRSC